MPDVGLHAVALDTQGEELAVFDKAGVDIDVFFHVLDGFGRRAGGNRSKQGNTIFVFVRSPFLSSK